MSTPLDSHFLLKNYFHCVFPFYSWHPTYPLPSSLNVDKIVYVPELDWTHIANAVRLWVTFHRHSDLSLLTRRPPLSFPNQVCCRYCLHTSGNMVF